MKFAFLFSAVLVLGASYMTPAHATTGIGSFEQNQQIERLVDEVLNGLQGSAQYNATVRPAALKAAQMDRQFANYLFELRDGLKAPAFTNGTEDEKTKDRSMARLSLEMTARNIARGL